MIIHAEHRFRKESQPIQIALQAVAGEQPSFTKLYEDNHEAMYFCVMGTLREYRRLQKLVMIDPSVENMEDLQEASGCIDDLLGETR